MVPPASVLIIALVIDRLLGDPRTPLHPVALLGRFIERWASLEFDSPAARRACGVLGCISTLLLFSLPFSLVSIYARGFIYILIGPFLLWVCTGWRSLEEHVEAVEEALARGESGAREVGMLVSRYTGGLSPVQVRSAAYESMAENLTDSIIAPIFYFGLLGLGGAALYRAANTMDAMVGYRDHRADTGWCAARLDDLLTWLPARICGLVLLCYFAFRGRFRPAWETLRRDSRKRPGWNGGIPMATIAGGVGVAFEKPGVYLIGTPERTLADGGPEIVRAVRAATAITAVLIAVFLLVVPPALHPLW
ncbi:MAG: adenosylcobinamide-phosphate synthase CbiB [Methanoculleaceae archaeon]